MEHSVYLMGGSLNVLGVVPVMFVDVWNLQARESVHRQARGAGEAVINTQEDEGLCWPSRGCSSLLRGVSFLRVAWPVCSADSDTSAGMMVSLERSGEETGRHELTGRKYSL